ncbi:MAG TPA: GNAT family N-acetyltransferase [Dehalococcoidia bacterium]|nr:GNAT family N-acetyltransferase [Dehalococcoidia bacterium]
MTTAMPALESARLVVRPFVMEDLDACHQLLDLEAWQTRQTLEQRRTWLQWAVLNYDALSGLLQYPYGDRAVVLKSTGELVGSVGLVPGMGLFDRLPSFGGDVDSQFMRPEVGMFWATRTGHLRRGYATEAAQALVDYAFGPLQLRRLIATTTYDNAASQAVMRHLGMSIERNPLPEPAWFQVVGVLQNPAVKEPR